MDNFDLHRDSNYCPRARSSLKYFFDQAKGSDWTVNRNWESEYLNHCTYHGVTCADDGSVVGIRLNSNGLAGRISVKIGDMHSLRQLNLHDNDIRGEIPSELGKLTQLQKLNLAYNSFVGEIPTELSNVVKNLKSLQLHGNRLTGEIEGINRTTSGYNTSDLSLFVTDCGYPSDALTPVTCEGCTMCCNANGQCEARNNEGGSLYLVLNRNDTSAAYSYYVFLVLGLCCVLFLVSFLRGKCWKVNANQNVDFRHLIGKDSIYSLLIREKWSGWIGAILVVIIQSGTFLIFYLASDLDLERSDYYNIAWVYSYWCPRNEDCRQQIIKSPLGWIFFGFLVAFHMTPDIYNGSKIIWLIANKSWNGKAFRCLVAGYIKLLVSTYAIVVSITYNIANANSDTELIINAVILLFIADFDELCFRILEQCFPGYLEEKEIDKDLSNIDKQRAPVASTIDGKDYTIQQLQKQIDKLKLVNKKSKKENATMKRDIMELKSQVKLLLPTPTKPLSKTTKLSPKTTKLPQESALQDDHQDYNYSYYGADLIGDEVSA